MRRLLFFIILLYGTVYAYSQNENWMNFSKNTNASCTIDDGNFIWIGSYNGLLKYDKMMDTSYLYNASNSGLPENTVVAIDKDQDGAIWVATLDEGLVKFDGNSWEEIVSVNDYLSGGGIRDIFIDSNNVKWIATSKGLLMIDNLGLTVYNQTNSDIPSNDLFSIMEDNYSNLWLGTYGLIKYTGTEWLSFTYQNTNLPLGLFYDIEKGNNNDIWCTCGGHLVKIDSNGFSTYAAPEHSFYSVAVDQNDSVFVGTWDGEFAYQQFYNNTWYTFNSNNSGITNSNIRQVFVDNDNNKWFVGDDGLDKLASNNTWHFSNISNSGLPNNRINSIAVGHDGLNYFCTLSGVIGYNWTDWVNLIDVGRSDQICFDNDNNLLIANPHTVYVYNDGTLTDTMNTPFGGYPIGSVNKITTDQNDNIWMTFPNDDYNIMKGGLFKYDGSNWTIYNESNSGIPHSNITDIAVDNANNIWIATSGGGIAKFSNDNWTVYNKDNSPLPYDFITAITIDSLNNIWVAMPYETVAFFDGTSWTVYDNTTYPFFSEFTDISFDSEGNLWGVGLHKIAKFDLTDWEYFDDSNSPIPHNNTVSLAIDQNDNIFTGTNINGLYIFNENGINPVIIGTDETEETPTCRIFPNPSTGEINIELVSNKENQNLRLSVYNISGIKVYSSEQYSNRLYNLNLTKLEKGMYILQIESDSDVDVVIEKIIIH